VHVAPAPRPLRRPRLAATLLLVAVPVVPWAFWAYALRHPLTFTLSGGQATPNDETVLLAGWAMLLAWTLVLAASPRLTRVAWPGIERRAGIVRVVPAMLATLVAGWAWFVLSDERLASSDGLVNAAAAIAFWAAYLVAGGWALRAPRRALLGWPLALLVGFAASAVVRLALV
jgi:hypothetical protein